MSDDLLSNTTTGHLIPENNSIAESACEPETNSSLVENFEESSSTNLLTSSVYLHYFNVFLFNH